MRSGGFRRVQMTSVTIQLTEQEIRALKARTGKRDAESALKAWLRVRMGSTPWRRSEPR